MKLYVGNLPWSTDDAELEKLFSAHGEVHSATVITDRDSGRSRGFGFVEMSDEDARKAMSELNGTQVDSREIRVNEANERPRSSAGGRY